MGAEGGAGSEKWGCGVSHTHELAQKWPLSQRRSRHDVPASEQLPKSTKSLQHPVADASRQVPCGFEASSARPRQQPGNKRASAES